MQRRVYITPQNELVVASKWFGIVTMVFPDHVKIENSNADYFDQMIKDADSDDETSLEFLCDDKKLWKPVYFSSEQIRFLNYDSQLVLVSFFETILKQCFQFVFLLVATVCRFDCGCFDCGF